jgi:hypothetical protein
VEVHQVIEIPMSNQDHVAELSATGVPGHHLVFSRHHDTTSVKTGRASARV